MTTGLETVGLFSKENIRKKVRNMTAEFGCILANSKNIFEILLQKVV